ncbi:hypothetical protein [Streptomyces sp. NPDC001165]|uniref:hypothetical protein n=1 Tax=Streptomyces sp. NPDC001165 TaxID=3364546 RepID=UPI0036B826CB
METKYLARLQFKAESPVVEGEWTRFSTAEDRYTEWVGLYSKDPNVVVWLIEATGGRERVLRTWTARGETVS